MFWEKPLSRSIKALTKLKCLVFLCLNVDSTLSTKVLLFELHPIAKLKNITQIYKNP